MHRSFSIEIYKTWNFHVSISFRSLTKWSPKKRGGGGSGWGGIVYHTSTGQYQICRGGNFFFQPGVKLDEKSIESGLEVQKFLVVCLFWGGCHHPYITVGAQASICLSADCFYAVKGKLYARAIHLGS